MSTIADLSLYSCWGENVLQNVNVNFIKVSAASDFKIFKLCVPSVYEFPQKVC